MSNKTPIPEGKYFTSTQGHRIHYHEVGTAAGSKQTVMFLHGSGPGASGYSNFKQSLPAFAEQGYHVLAPDYLGYGLSDKPANVEYTVEMQVALLRELLAHCGVRSLATVGNSLGGWLALYHALEYPSEVSKLILMAPGGLEEREKFAHQMEGLKELFRVPLERDFTMASFRKLIALFVQTGVDTTDASVQERIDIAKQQPVEVFTTLKGPVVGPRLNEIKIPVLALWGSHDRFIPLRHSDILLAGLPQLELLISNQVGHWFMIEKPKLFNDECLRFLAADGAGES